MRRVQPTNMFAEDIKTLGGDIEEFKQFQRAGDDSVKMYRVFSDNAVDKSMTNVEFNNTRFRITFTPDETNFNTSVVYKMEYTYTEGSGNSVEIDVQREKIATNNSQGWLVSVSGSDFFPNTLVEMKFYFWASGLGTFSITDL